MFIKTALPLYRKHQHAPSEPGMKEKMFGKMSKVIGRGYLLDEFVHSVINCFPVPKGIGDICLVYDSTKSGLNAAVFAPNFFLPSMDSLLLMAVWYTYYSDRDLGEQFLNYFMDKRV